MAQRDNRSVSRHAAEAALPELKEFFPGLTRTIGRTVEAAAPAPITTPRTDKRRAMNNVEHEPREPRSSTCGRPRAGTEDQRSRHLISSAGALFLEHGYHHVSLAMIANEAHVALRTIYAQFGGKAGLFEAFLRDWSVQFEAAADLLDPSAGCVGHVLHTFAYRYVHLLQHPTTASILRCVAAESEANSGVKQIYNDVMAGCVRRALGRYFATQSVREQLRGDLAQSMLPGYFLACISGDYLPCASRPDHASDEIVRLLELPVRLKLFLRSVLQEPSLAEQM